MGKTCLPYVRFIGGWHSFGEEALLDPLRSFADVKTGMCTNRWDSMGKGDTGVMKWLAANAPGGEFNMPPAGSKPVISECNQEMSWYPAFAGRFGSTYLNEFSKCKTELAKAGESSQEIEHRTCAPRALAAHDAAIGTSGPGKEATPPYALRLMFGTNVKIVAVVRNPVDRLESAFWLHDHYPGRYGKSAEGLHLYAKEQTEAFSSCEQTQASAGFEGSSATRRCAHLFELLGKKEAEVFYHADQVIRSLYEPFLRDWHGAFGERLLVLRAEDLLDDSAGFFHTRTDTRKRALHFMGLEGLAAASLQYSNFKVGSYKELHAGTRVAAPPEAEMLDSTRKMLVDFFAPHNARLAELLKDERFKWVNEVPSA